ncbi:MAG: Mut7-C RNAse domain-containing protein [Candidatus Micrarchaeota archaeon]
MLGNLASWCRILGIDSSCFKGDSDSQLIQEAEQQNRIVITRDSELAKRCGTGGAENRTGCGKPDAGNGVRCVLVRGGTLEEQLAQILKETGAEVSFPEKTRCASCNGELEGVPKESVKEDVETETFAHTEKFWRCRECRKVFWEGGHWKNIRRIYGDAKRIAAQQ